MTVWNDLEFRCLYVQIDLFEAQNMNSVVDNIHSLSMYNCQSYHKQAVMLLLTGTMDLQLGPSFHKVLLARLMKRPSRRTNRLHQS